MPEVSFRKEITEDQLDMIQVALKLTQKSFEEYAWLAIIDAVKTDIENPEHTTLYGKMKELTNQLWGPE